MKKFVLKLDLQDDRDQQRRALKTVSALSGIDQISVDLKAKKLTIIGTVDPVTVVSKLRKKGWPADIILVGPAKEPEKKEEKKEEPKKEEPKKEEAKKEEAKEEPKKKNRRKKQRKKNRRRGGEEGGREKLEPTELVLGTAMQYRPGPYYRPYYPPMNTYYVQPSIEENPNACVIF